MKTTIVLTLLMFVFPEVCANAEHDPHHEQTVQEIGQMKDRLKHLRDFIDKINRNNCQSAAATVVQCEGAKVRDLFKCITSPGTSPLIKRITFDFARKFETVPVVAPAIASLNFVFGCDVEVSPVEIQRNSFLLQVKSDDLFAPIVVSPGHFSCPSKLERISSF